MIIAGAEESSVELSAAEEAVQIMEASQEVAAMAVMVQDQLD